MSKIKNDNLKCIEIEIVNEAKLILSSKKMNALKSAFRKGNAKEFKINGRVIIVEPDLPYSGMTISEESGFLLGKEAFSSNEELTKTILHELYRLKTSNIIFWGSATRKDITEETGNALAFADYSYENFFKKESNYLDEKSQAL